MRIHISLRVKNLEASMAFYEQLFGKRASKVRHDYVNFRLQDPPIHLALTERLSDTPGSGVSHFGVELEDHGVLQKWRDRLNEHSILHYQEDSAQCCYAVADKVWATDPDGYRWEIWVRTGDQETETGGLASEGEVLQNAACPQSDCCA